MAREYEVYNPFIDDYVILTVENDSEAYTPDFEMEIEWGHELIVPATEDDPDELVYEYGVGSFSGGPGESVRVFDDGGDYTVLISGTDYYEVSRDTPFIAFARLVYKVFGTWSPEF